MIISGQKDGLYYPYKVMSARSVQLTRDKESTKIVPHILTKTLKMAKNVNIGRCWYGL